MKSELIRVQKVIADRGLASRREAESWISEGRVTVNGDLVSLGDKCDPSSDLIEVDGSTITRKEPKKRVIALHKPKGYVCTNRDPHASRTVFDLLPPDLASEKLFCVGRLDKDSEGLIILTNDGDLNQRLAHPTYHIIKKYRVLLDKPYNSVDTRRMIQGITWEGERLSVEKVIPFKGKSSTAQNQIEIHMQHGRKREIRRLLYALGYDVKKLQRYQIGGLPLKGIGKGKFQILTAPAIKLLLES